MKEYIVKRAKLISILLSLALVLVAAVTVIPWTYSHVSAATLGAGTNVNIVIDHSDNASAAYSSGNGDTVVGDNQNNKHRDVSGAGNYFRYHATFPAGAQDTYLRAIVGENTQAYTVKIATSVDGLETAQAVSPSFTGNYIDAAYNLNYYDISGLIAATGDTQIYVQFENAKLFRIRFLSSNLEAVADANTDSGKDYEFKAGIPTYSRTFSDGDYAYAEYYAAIKENNSATNGFSKTNFFDFESGDFATLFVNGGGAYCDNRQYMSYMLHVPANSTAQAVFSISEGNVNNARMSIKDISDNANFIYDLKGTSNADGNTNFTINNCDSNNYGAGSVDGDATKSSHNFGIEEGNWSLMFNIPIKDTDKTYYIECSNDKDAGNGLQITSTSLFVSEPTVAEFLTTDSTIVPNVSYSASNFMKRSIPAESNGVGQQEHFDYFDNKLYATYKLPYDSAIVGDYFIRIDMNRRYVFSVLDKTGKPMCVSMTTPKEYEANKTMSFYIDANKLPGGIANYIVEEEGNKFIKIRAEGFVKNRGNGAHLNLITGIQIDNAATDNILVVPKDDKSIEAKPNDESKIFQKLGTGLNNNDRYADRGEFFTYCADFGDNFGATAKGFLVFKANRAENAIYEISTDNKTWTTILSLRKDDGGSVTDVTSAHSLYFYDLSTVLQGSTHGKIYFRVGAKDISAGYGGYLYQIQFFGTAMGVITDYTDINKNSVSVDPADVWNLHGEHDSQVNGGGKRYADNGRWFSMKIKYTVVPQNAYIKLNLAGDNRYLRISNKTSNDGDYVDLTYKGMAGGVMENADFYDGYFQYFNITDELLGAAAAGGEANTIYLKFCAKDTNQGNGACVESLAFLNNYDIPTGTGTGHCNEFSEGKMNLNVPIFVDTFINSENKGEIAADSDNNNLKGRFTSTNSFVYKVSIPAGAEFAYAKIVASGRKLIDISKDGTFADAKNLCNPGLAIKGDPLSKGDNDGAVYKEIMSGAGDTARANYYYSLNTFLNEDGTKTDLYLRFKGDTKGDNPEERYVYLFNLEFWYNIPYDTEITLPTNYVVDVETAYAGGKSEKQYIEKKSGVGYDPSQGINYVDKESEMIYKFDIDKTAVATKLVVDLKAGYIMSVSTDGNNYTDVGIAPVQFARWKVNGVQVNVHDANGGLKQFNISALAKGKEKLFVKIADATIDGDFGACYSSLQVLQVKSTDGATPSGNTLFIKDKLVNNIAVYDASLLYSDNGSAFDYTGRSVKGDSSFAYKFDLPQDATSFFLACSTVAVDTNNDIKVMVSSNGADYANVPASSLSVKTSTFSNSSVCSSYTVDLGYFLKTSKTVYVKFSAKETSDSNKVVLASLYTGYNTKTLSSRGEAVTKFNKSEYNTFITGTGSELEYIHDISAEDIMGSKGEDGSWLDRNNLFVNKADPNTCVMEDGSRTLNKESYAIYKLEYNALAEQINIIGAVANTFLISISKDNISYTDVLMSDTQHLYKWFIDSGSILSETAVEVDVDISAFKNDAHTIYVKITNPITDMVSGANYKSLGIASYWDKKPEAQEKPAEKGCGCSSTISNVSEGVVLLFGVLVVAFAVVLIIAPKKKKNS